MNRRTFIASAGIITTGAIKSASTRSALAVSFDIANNVTIPENWSDPTVKINFDEFKIIANNIDSDYKLDVDILAKFNYSSSYDNIYSDSIGLKSSSFKKDFKDLFNPVMLSGTSLGIKDVLNSKSVGESISIDMIININHRDINNVKTKKDSFTITITSTVPNTVIDNFESDNLDRYYGDKSYFSLDNNTYYEGYQGLNADSNSNPKVITRNDYDIGRDSKFIWYMKGNGNQWSDAGLVFGASGTDSTDLTGYCAKIGRVNTLSIIEWKDGTINYLNRTEDNFDGGGWYKIIVEWKSIGKIVLSIYQSGTLLDSISYSTDKYKSGKIGWQSIDGNQQSWIDFLSVEPLK